LRLWNRVPKTASGYEDVIALGLFFMPSCLDKT
jgi:hypothetical protein